jgi:hypothetical protein
VINGSDPGARFYPVFNRMMIVGKDMFFSTSLRDCVTRSVFPSYFGLSTNHFVRQPFERLIPFPSLAQVSVKSADMFIERVLLQERVLRTWQADVVVCSTSYVLDSASKSRIGAALGNQLRVTSAANPVSL